MITKEQFWVYEEVRRSGITNMFNIKKVTSLSGLTKEQCLEIMKNYSKLAEAFKNE